MFRPNSSAEISAETEISVVYYEKIDKIDKIDPWDWQNRQYWQSTLRRIGKIRRELTALFENSSKSRQNWPQNRQNRLKYFSLRYELPFLVETQSTNEVKAIRIELNQHIEPV